jgi:hypothetical protein
MPVSSALHLTPRNVTNILIALSYAHVRPMFNVSIQANVTVTQIVATRIRGIRKYKVQQPYGGRWFQR